MNTRSEVGVELPGIDRMTESTVETIVPEQKSWIVPKHVGIRYNIQQYHAVLVLNSPLIVLAHFAQYNAL